MAASTPDPRRWWALAIIAVAQFVVIMDTSIIGVALPEIQRALSFAQPDLSWVFNAYVIAFGGLLLLGGRLADLFGARRVFMIGFAILGGASLLTGLAWSDAILLAGRALQGVGSALIAPAALTMLMTLFSHDPRELTRALALYGAAAPAGGTAGVFLGGVLTASIDWRWVFLVNVPVAIAVLVASRGILPAGVRRPGRLDIAGAAAVTGALSLAVFGIVRGPIVGWAAPETIAAMAAAVVLFAIFVRIQATKAEPLMRLGIWRAPNLAAANISMALLGAAWIPTWFFLNLYLQQVLGLGAFESGMALVPMTLAIMILMVAVTGRVVARFGFKRPLIAGLVILAGGITWLSLAPADGSYLSSVLPATIVAATGMAIAYIPAMMAALAGARPEEGGLAAGIVNTTYQAGSALGLAVVTAVATASGFGGAASPTDGFGPAFLIAAAIALVAAGIAALTLRERSGAPEEHRRKYSQPTAPATAPSSPDKHQPTGQGELTMNVTAAKLINSANLSAVVAGLLFVAIQVIHPADSLASVTTSAWAIVHYVSIAMAILFVIGIWGIYARQVEEVGWLGLAGVVVLSLGLLLTAAFQFVEAAVEPILASSAPGFVDGMLALVEMRPSNVDLGALPTLWSLTSGLFLAGTLLFGIATLRAGVAPRLAAGLFAFGLVLSAPVVVLLEAPRLAAVPIGLGLAWMGLALWAEGRRSSSEASLARATPRPDHAAAA